MGQVGRVLEFGQFQVGGDEMCIRDSSYALLYDGSSYTGSMIRFLNRFSKEAQTFSTEKVEQSRQLFFDVLNICKSIDKKAFLTQTGSFNVSLFDLSLIHI